MLLSFAHGVGHARSRRLVPNELALGRRSVRMILRGASFACDSAIKAARNVHLPMAATSLACSAAFLSVLAALFRCCPPSRRKV
jgi:hypothetical protein